MDRLDTEADNRRDPTEIPTVTDDPKDDYLVALYRDNNADLLVSGDSDLLDLTAADVTVVTPAELLDQVSTEQSISLGQTRPRPPSGSAAPVRYLALRRWTAACA